MTLSLVDIEREEIRGQPCYRILLHPFFQPFIRLLRDHHAECRSQSTRPDKDALPEGEAGAWLERDNEAHFRERAAWFLRLRWRADDNGRMILSATTGDVAFLLRVLNDMRLFCWDRMGRPDALPHLEHFSLRLEGFPRNREALLCILELCSVIQNEVAHGVAVVENNTEQA